VPRRTGRAPALISLVIPRKRGGDLFGSLQSLIFLSSASALPLDDAHLALGIVGDRKTEKSISGPPCRSARRCPVVRQGPL